jgi:ribonuclease T1
MGLRMLRLMGIVLAALLWLPQTSYGSSHGSSQGLSGSFQAAPAEQAGVAVISVGELPAEARNTLRAIKQGGPFAFPRDGVVFNNFERDLPEHQRGYYHEYTVITPGMNNRGIRRIISGENGEYYYTADHYQTFKLILE